MRIVARAININGDEQKRMCALKMFVVMLNGYVTIRWYGESNGCYSCEVMTEYTNPNDDILFKYELNPWGDEV